jgi:hypothetical protein
MHLPGPGVGRPPTLGFGLAFMTLLFKRNRAAG